MRSGHKKVYQNWYYGSILIFSLLSIIPFVFLISNILKVLNLLTALEVDLKEAQKIFSKTWLDPTIFYPFLIGLFIWISSSVISALFLTKKHIRPIYAFATLIFGGIGLHLVIWLLLNYFEIKKWQFNIQKIFIANTTLIMSAILPIGLFISALAYQGMEKPTKIVPINFSLNQKSPNLIEIFTDGFDQGNLVKIAENEEFQDFTWFKHFQTTGSVTHLSVPTIYGDFSEYNPFAIMQNNNFKTELEYKDFVYGQGWLETGVKHMQEQKDFFSQRSIVNPTTFSNRSDFFASNSGTPEAISTLDSSINVVNWTASRNDLANNWGITPFSPDSNGYQWVGQKSQYQSEKGARVFLLDLITHRPFLTNPNGQFNPWNFPTNIQLDSLQGQLDTLFSQLKEMKINNQSVYDNSLIIVYGDHSNHEQELINPESKNHNLSHMQSALMIKYPHQKQEKINIVSDRYVYSPQINTIINDYFESNDFTNGNFGQTYFNNKIFDNIARPAFLNSLKYQMIHWENNWLEPINNQIIEYNSAINFYKELKEVKYE